MRLESPSQRWLLIPRCILFFRGALVHETGVDATLSDDKITYHIPLLATRECLIDVNNLARREQDEVDEPNEAIMKKMKLQTSVVLQ